MLRGIDPLLGPDLLHALRAMGHGDVLAIVDRNFPAAACARRLIRLDGVDAIRAADAVLSVLPIDDFVTPATFRMQVVGEPDEVTDVQQEFAAALERWGAPGVLAGVERFDFYDRAREAFAVVTTSETRPYACFLLTKGVVR